MLLQEKRRYLRFSVFLDGSFQWEDGRVSGFIMLTDFCRQGFRASLSHEVTAGGVIKLEIWLPNSIVPVFAKGRIIWITSRVKDWTYSFDAGMKFEDIFPEDKLRITDYAYEYWRNSKRQDYEAVLE